MAVAGTVSTATCGWARPASRPGPDGRGRRRRGELQAGAAAAWPAAGGRRWGGGRMNHGIEAEPQERFAFGADGEASG
jgi:hypothetical protein